MATSCDIVEYLAEFGWTLCDLTADQLSMLVAARNASAWVEAIEIPVASQAQAQGGPVLAEREAQPPQELTAYCQRWLESRLPSDEIEVSRVHSVEDLPRIFPTQWLLEELQPAMFYTKLAEAELLMPIWQRPSQAPQDLPDSMPQRELAELAAAADGSKQHAYVLLDTSRTMNDHDRRGTIARGLALAFLLGGYRQRACLNLRPFTATVGDLSCGTSQEDLQAISRRVLDLPNSGQTRIQAALEKAIEDVREAGPCQRADILLITDGISHLAANPLCEERLHTFILGDLFETQRQAGTIATLQQWSSTFHRIWKNRFPEILAPRICDLRAAGAALEQAIERWKASAADSPSHALLRTLANVRRLLEEFRRSLGKQAPVPPEFTALQELLGRAEEAVGWDAKSAPEFDQRPANSGRARWSAAWTSAGAEKLSPDSGDPWDWLKRLAARAWRWACHRCARLLPRRP